MRTRLAEYERNKAATLAALRGYLRIASVNGEAPPEAVGGTIARAIAQ